MTISELAAGSNCIWSPAAFRLPSKKQFVAARPAYLALLVHCDQKTISLAPLAVHPS